MEEHVAALHTATNALQALGRGFDVNFDTRLLYCKGVSGSRVVEIDEQYQRDLFLYDDVVVTNVSRDIRSCHESMGRQSSGVCSFQECRGLVGLFLFGEFEFGFGLPFIVKKNCPGVEWLLTMDLFMPPN
ncbi:MACPF domain-containing protein CAD1-like [Trifolium pratense]|uniref:MACPF domain-containing protein CAD1-like n=1 Tax=Trifolium pratense TaxID=57577 RepID=A0A2K3NHA1_TRIPR|nr:MACPF domain-containing protein CAD1-like [Trifolium pratense]